MRDRDLYMESLRIIMNPDSMLLPERGHLVALYKRIQDLEAEREKATKCHHRYTDELNRCIRCGEALTA